MYHIFLIIAVAASQDQIVQIQQQFEQQKAAYIQSNQTTENGEDKEDIISQLKKQIEAEEKAMKLDLESLGLDPIDTTPSKNSQLKVEKDNITTITTQSPPKDLPDLKQNLSKIDKPTKTSQPEVSKIIQIENKSDKKSLIKKVFSRFRTAKQETKKQQPIKKNKIVIDNKTATKVVEKILPKKNVKPDTISNKKKKELTKKRREQRITKKRILAELKQQQKTQKLEALRQQYLQEGEGDDIYEGVNHYQMMNKIIPQKKIPPKFLNSEVPPPLLSRVRGHDNKHHPIIINNSEKIDFMFKAIAENRIDDFNSIFSLVKNPNIKNSFGDTLLTFAILMGRHDAVSSLISKGADPNLTNDLGYTPLNVAIEMVDYKSVSILIEIGGAKVDFIDDLGRTYLMQASRVGSLPITDLLISKGVGTNIADNNGITALAIAYKHKKNIIAKYLLKYGAKSWVKKNYVDDDASMVEDLFNKWK